MKRFFILICFLFYTINSFAVEKSKTFGDFTVYPLKSLYRMSRQFLNNI